MAEFKAALLAFAKLLTAFVDAGGVQTCVDLWRQRLAESAARAELAAEKTLASRLARGDAVAVESEHERLLFAASGADSRRPAAEGGRGGQRDDDPGIVRGDAASVAAMQREIDALVR